MHILFFAQVKDAVGVADLNLNITGEATATELWNQLIAIRPELAPYRQTTRLARNGEYVDAQALFTNGDEVALIPPVSGG